MDVVYPKVPKASVSAPDGRTAHIRLGQHWPTTDPVVRAYPDLFTDDPRYGLQHTPGYPPPGYDDQLNELESRVGGDVEEAAAVPGERRSVRRRRVVDDTDPISAE